MSNTALREGAPKSRRELERHLREEALIQRAADKIYLAEGGAALEKLIELAETTLQAAKACREDDLRRVAENPKVTWREKGERPLVSVSEQRLHMNLSERYLREKQFLRGNILSRIRETIAGFEPQSEEELRALLDGLVSAASGQAVARNEAMLKELLPALPEAQRKDLLAALALNDATALNEVLAKMPDEVRKRVAA